MNAMIEPEEYDSLPEITKRIGKYTGVQNVPVNSRSTNYSNRKFQCD